MDARFLGGAKDFFLLQSMETGYGANPASYPVGMEYYFPGRKAAWT
jgi:hypothetical protein